MMLARRREMGREELCKIEWRGDADGNGTLELLIAARIDAEKQGRGVVYQHIHTPMLPDHGPGKGLQRIPVRQIPHKMISGEYSAQDYAPRPSELSIHSGGIEQSRRGR